MFLLKSCHIHGQTGKTMDYWDGSRLGQNTIIMAWISESVN